MSTPLPYETVREAIVKQLEFAKGRLEHAHASVREYCEGRVDGLEAALKLMDTGLRSQSPAGHPERREA